MFLHFVKLAFLLLSVLIITAHAVAQGRVEYSGEDEVKIGFQTLRYLAASDSIVSLSLAKSLYDQGRFIVNEKPDLNLGIASDNYWVTFTVFNSTATNEEVYINLENPRLNEVNVFILKQDSVVQSLRLGDNFPFQERAIQYAEFAFPVYLTAKDSLSVFLFIKHKGNTLQMPVRLLSRSKFLVHVESNYLFSGMVTGIFLITFIFGLFFLFNTKDLLFMYYSGYIFTAGAWLWTTEGFAFQYIWPDSPELATRLGPGISAFSACFFLANCLQFCKPYDDSSRQRKILKWVLALLLIWSTAPFWPFIPINEKTMAVYLSVYFIFNIFLCVILLAYLSWLSLRQLIVLYYLIAVLITITCSFAVVLKGGGLISIPLSSGTIMGLGYVIELILMTAGITKQFYNYRQDKEKALRVNLELQTSINEKILQTQNEERNRISRELHDDIGPRITQITMMTESVKKGLPAKSSMFEDLSEITDASRDLVASLGEIVWSLNPENRTLRDLLSFLREQLNKLLEYSGIEYKISFEAKANGELNHTQLRNILLVTMEIAHNAVKHSQATNITIACHTKESQIHFIVSDNGKGFGLSKPGHGNGMRNIRQRVDEVGGLLSIESELGKGATFIYSIPF